MGMVELHRFDVVVECDVQASLDFLTGIRTEKNRT